jgi:diaminopimelate epimerase
MEIPFAKLQAAGNGYIVIDGRDLDCDWCALAPQITHPNFGIGSDGLAIVEPSEVAAVRMRIVNSDGSESEMSGNGIRLLAKFVLDRGLARPDSAANSLAIETAAGIRRVEPVMRDGRMLSGRVAMGTPAFAPSEIPATSAGSQLPERLVDFPLDLGARTLPVTCLSIGNPHAVAILDEPVADFDLARWGPLVQNHPLFPNRINFEVVNVLDRSNLRVRVFERGEGETLASGTGSTASAVAARVHELIDDASTIHLAGGTLGVRWAGSGEALLEGPTTEVFTGVFTLPGPPPARRVRA